MLNIVCVNKDNYLGRGKEYVEILHDMVRRNLSDKTEGQFVCFTDDPEPYAEGIIKRDLPDGLKGWWNKLYLFKDGVFQEGDRIVFLDLDTVIVGGLDDLVKYDGPFALLRDFYRPQGYQSSVMMWTPSERTANIWTQFQEEGFPDVPGGDQAFIEGVMFGADILQDQLPGCFVSYKVHSRVLFPKGSKVVCFHGRPRPHEVAGWVTNVWKIGGGTSLELECVGNTSAGILVRNIRQACSSDVAPVRPVKAHEGHAVIVGGGPSLKDSLEEIKQRKEHGQTIFSTNATAGWLFQNGIKPDYHIMLDARPENAAFIPPFEVTKLYASQCDPSVTGQADGIWHALMEGVLETTDHQQAAYIGCGSSVGLKAMGLAYLLGFRNMHLYGMDSSYRDGEHHAYSQSLNDGERVVDVTMGGKEYRAAAWMTQQVNEFVDCARKFIEDGCSLTVHGEGLLPDMARFMGQGKQPDREIVQKDGVWWPSQDIEARISVGSFSDEHVGIILSKCKGFSVAVQAGGNVGIWPRLFAEKFKTVYTFEPDHLNFRCLCLNAGNENIIKFQAAIGSKRGLVDLERDSWNCGSHHVNGTGPIPTLRIDDLGLEACDLIQLDIEGQESFALEGARETIQRFRPVIVIEEKGLGEKYGVSPSQADDFLKELCYTATDRFGRDVLYQPQ